MAISIYNCWACDKKLTHDRGPEDCFFWCNESCEETYQAEITRKSKPLKEWSAYMAGERLCPKDMKPHDADHDKAIVSKPGKKKPVKADKSPKSLEAIAAGVAARKKAKKSKKGSKRVRKMKDAGRRTVICGNCGEPGHNSRTCEE